MNIQKIAKNYSIEKLELEKKYKNQDKKLINDILKKSIITNILILAIAFSGISILILLLLK